MNNDVKLSIRSFAQFQFGFVTVVVLIGLLNYLIPAFAGSDSQIRTLDLFDVGEEGSLPSWFSTVNLFFSAMLLFLVYRDSVRQNFRHKTYWLLLAVSFFVLSLDESAELHERLERFQGFASSVAPVLATHAWVLYGSIIAFIFFLVFIPFLRMIHKRTAVLFVISGAIFLLGSLGLEFVGAIMRYTGIAEADDLIYKIRRVFEEGFEMYGIAIFNYAIFRELIHRRAKFEFVHIP